MPDERTRRDRKDIGLEDMRGAMGRHDASMEPDFESLLQRLAEAITEPDIGKWMTDGPMLLFSVFRRHPRYWGLIKATYRKWGGNAYDLEKAVDHSRVTHGLDAHDADAGEVLDPFVFTDVTSILATEAQSRRWLLPGIIADGLTLLGGSPKGGKTYLAYALALAVSHYGRWCNHWQVEQGKVIYITLEDDSNDTHLRLLELDPHLALMSNRLLFVHGQDTIPTFGSGLREWLEATLELHHPRLMIIDPISYLYVLKKTGSQFEETKDMLFPLQWLGKTYQCAIVCLDHRRKRSREDVSMVDTLYGSVAKQAVPSGIIMVNRDQDDIELDMIIRNGQQQKEYLSFTFQDGRCFLAYKGGEQQPMTQSELRMRLLDILRKAPLPMTLPDLLLELGMTDTRQGRSALWQLLYRAMKAREIEKTSRGRYVISTEDG
jgi:hypothetical protein